MNSRCRWPTICDTYPFLVDGNPFVVIPLNRTTSEDEDSNNLKSLEQFQTQIVSSLLLSLVW